MPLDSQINPAQFYQGADFPGMEPQPPMYDFGGGMDTQSKPPESNLLDDVLSTGFLLSLFGGDISGLQRALQDGMNPQPTVNPMLQRLMAQPGSLDEMVTGGHEGYTRTGDGSIVKSKSIARDRFKNVTGFDPRSDPTRLNVDGIPVERGPNGEIRAVPRVFPKDERRLGPANRQSLAGAFGDRGLRAVAEDLYGQPTMRNEKVLTNQGIAPTTLSEDQLAKAKALFAQRDAMLADPSTWQQLGQGEAQGRLNLLRQEIGRGTDPSLLTGYAKQPTALEAFSGALKTDEARQSKEAEAKFQRAMRLMGLAEKVEQRQQSKQEREARLAFDRERFEAGREAKQTEAQQKALTAHAKEIAERGRRDIKLKFKDDPAQQALAHKEIDLALDKDLSAIREGENPFAKETKGEAPAKPSSQDGMVTSKLIRALSSSAGKPASMNEVRRALRDLSLSLSRGGTLGAGSLAGIQTLRPDLNAEALTALAKELAPAGADEDMQLAMLRLAVDEAIKRLGK